VNDSTRSKVARVLALVGSVNVAVAPVTAVALLMLVTKVGAAWKVLTPVIV
jgi:hypothetical protein